MAFCMQRMTLGAMGSRAALPVAGTRPALARGTARRAAAVAPVACLPFWPFRRAAAPLVPPPPPVLLEPSVAFTGATVLVLPVYFAMIAFPGSKLTRRLVDSPIIPLLLGIPYAILLFQAWQSGALTAIFDAVKASSPLPDASALAEIFKRPALTALAWLHLLMLDLLQARAVLLDGLSNSIPTGHSVALCCMFGPLGVLSHLITRWVLHKARGAKGDLPAFA